MGLHIAEADNLVDDAGRDDGRTVRQHLRHLVDAGCSTVGISEATGIAHERIVELLNNYPSYQKYLRLPDEEVRVITSVSILKVLDIQTQVPYRMAEDVLIEFRHNRFPMSLVDEHMGCDEPYSPPRPHMPRTEYEHLFELYLRWLKGRVPGVEPPYPDRSDPIAMLAEVLEYRIDHRAWHADAECVRQGFRTADFFHNRGVTHAANMEVCVECPVRSQCQEATQFERYGVAALYSQRSRVALRRQQNS